MTMSTASPSCCSTESVLPSNRQLHDHHPGCSAVTPPPLPLSPPRVLCSQTTKAMITTQGILSSNRQFYYGKLGLHPFYSFLAFIFLFSSMTGFPCTVNWREIPPGTIPLKYKTHVFFTVTCCAPWQFNFEPRTKRALSLIHI